MFKAILLVPAFSGESGGEPGRALRSALKGRLEVGHDDIWLVSVMDYDLEYIDLGTCALLSLQRHVVR